MMALCVTLCACVRVRWTSNGAPLTEEELNSQPPPVHIRQLGPSLFKAIRGACAIDDRSFISCFKYGPRTMHIGVVAVRLSLSASPSACPLYFSDSVIHRRVRNSVS